MEVFGTLYRNSTPHTPTLVSKNHLLAAGGGRLRHLSDRLSPKVAICLLSIAIGSTLWSAASTATTLMTTETPAELPVLISQSFDGGSSIGLQLGDSGDSVATLQQQLANAGYYTGSIDGDFGPQTEAAVIRFQQASGLVADGIVGPATDAALRNAASAPASPVAQTPVPNDSGFLQLDSAGERVANLQTRLRDIGYYNDTITGVFGPQTEAAVIRFQQANGLAADGIVGPSTEAALNSVSVAAPPQVTVPPIQTPPPVQTVPPPVVVQPAPSPVAQAELGSVEGRFSVIELQRRLQARGFNPGPVDGVFGAQTRSAIAEAQRAYGLTQADILNGRF
ncbi:peptidoglycan-binding protein [Oculatella sp. LEGE 06141]|uniref:peptidoglycan-binding domain-containing protein n=1 Tax=Oculatella sp. LEGE 06141 TaxID=1828648 RepID=UPI00187ECA5E|nr:peptidoglycan-binding protein [Oculatella sp. LEGE 06141]MBE9177594.1 peptidoglycan-binding protein [Oculatella sp. LEGE 06141]